MSLHQIYTKVADIIGWHPVEEQPSLARRILDLLEAGDTEQAKYELRKELPSCARLTPTSTLCPRPMTPDKFQHAGLDWIPHIPGDPMPCSGDTVVRVLLREEEDGRRYCDEQQRASAYDWIEFGAPSIIGWHPIEN